MTKPKAIKNEFIGSGLSKEEIALGRLRYNEYRKVYPQLNKMSNLQLLEELVWLEMLQERYKSQVGKITEPTKKPDGTWKIEPVPSHLQESIADNLTQIMDMKTKLGLFEDQKTLDAYRDFDVMKKKAEQYRREHPLEFKTTCPHCAKYYFLKRRTTNYEEFISPFYADDKVLKNTPLHNLWLQGKINQEEYSAVLGVSPDQIIWLSEKIFRDRKKPGE